jgi:tetratricopeptide (TPR) repeat protein
MALWIGGSVRFIAIFTTALVCSAVVQADDGDAKKQARAHFIAGTAFYDAGSYDRAISEYRAAYKILPLPGLLFNLGQAYRLHGDFVEARDSYQRYLDTEPTGAIADEAREHVRELLPPKVAPVVRPSPVLLTPSAAPVPLVIEPAPAPVIVAQVEPPHRRRWIIPVAVVGGILVVGAVILGVTLGTAGASYPNTLGMTTPK